jgi:toxin ParE1/3/4
MSHVRFSKRANLDIEEILDYLVELNPAAADRFLDALDKTCKLLAEHSLLGRARPEIGEGIRSFAVGSYLVFYTPASDGIAVFRVLYGGRDLQQVFHSTGRD